MKRNPLFLSTLILATLFTLAACGGDSSNETDYKTSVVGANGDSGKLSIFLDAAAETTAKINEAETIVTVTGTLEMADGITNMAGEYDTESKMMVLTGGEYSFVGETGDNGKISGEYTKGLEEGIFAGFDSSTNDVEVYCGTYTSDTCVAQGCSGVWSATTSSGGFASGTYFGDDGVSNGTLWGTFSNGTMTGEDDHGSIMTGTIVDGVVTGTWTLDDGIETTTGTFEASTESCP